MNNKHKGLLQFIRRIVGVPLGYSIEEMVLYRSLATKQYPAFVKIIDQYIDMATEASVDDDPARASNQRAKKASQREMHLFDLLRDKRLFPLNSDLADFAGRIVPGMQRGRFRKISKVEIAARIIEYLETLEPDTQGRLERSMRAALKASPARSKMPSTEKESFFTRWERIIKRIEL